MIQCLDNHQVQNLLPKSEWMRRSLGCIDVPMEIAYEKKNYFHLLKAMESMPVLPFDGDLSVAVDDDSSSQYLEDPSLFRDELPQPFRMINKLLGLILDSAWDAIAEHASQSLKNAAKKQAPQYACATLIHDVSNVTVLTTCPSDRYLYVSTYQGELVCIDADTQQMIASWKPDNESAGAITIKMHANIFEENINLITTVDIAGTVKLFLHLKDILILAYTFNDTVDDATRKQNILDVNVSLVADYLGLVVTDVADQPTANCCWIEINRIPKDAWLKELESLSQHASATNLDDSTKMTLPAIKFSAPSVTLKLRGPAMPAGITWNSPYQAFKNVEAGLPEKGIGTGTCHVISRHHLDLRTTAFNMTHLQHAALIQSQTVNEMIPATRAVRPVFHFLPRAKFACSLTDRLSDQLTSTVAVWWTGSSQVLQYNLTRSVKETEVSRPDVVWPMAYPVVDSAVTPCGCLFAVALNNNDIVIYDRTVGLVRRVVHSDDSGPIINMFFHELTSEGVNQQCNHGLVAESAATGHLYSISCCTHDETLPTAVYCDAESSDEIPVALKQVVGMPELLLVCRQDGRLFVHDINKREQLCELVLPDAGDQDNRRPLKPTAFSTLDCGRNVFVIATSNDQTSSDVTSTDGSTQQSEAQLLVYKLVYFPTFDNYFRNLKAAKSSRSEGGKLTLEDKVNAALRSRTCSEAERLERLHRRWFEMKEQFQIQPTVQKTGI